MDKVVFKTILFMFAILLAFSVLRAIIAVLEPLMPYLAGAALAAIGFGVVYLKRNRL